MTRSVYTKTYDEFRKLLVEARVKSGLTQADLSASLARPQSFVSKYERGERRLDIIEFLEIAEVLGFDPGAFLGRLLS